jgi:hypothetical protein
MARSRWIPQFVALLGTVAACVSTPHLHRPEDAPALRSQSDQPLKVHLRSGQLVVLNQWQESDSALRGTGTLYRPDRTFERWDQFVIPLESIALLETSTSGAGGGAGITVMAVWSTLWGALTIACVADPKSCFGSCPTFYVDDVDSTRPLAEGFSSSIARALEARDVDALYRARATGAEFTIRMKNEALETHAVRSLRLLVAPRPKGRKGTGDPAGRVLQGADGRFYPASSVEEPVRCTDESGDCLGAVVAFDSLERQSLTDSADLAVREAVDLEFPPAAGRVGVVLGARQTMVSTFLFYQTMAYLGHRAGDWLAALERMKPEQAAQAMGLARTLGGIDVETPLPNGGWRKAGTFDEPGPIATDVMVIPIEPQPPGSAVRVRLRLAKGAWRINYVALAELGAPVEPMGIEPSRVERSGAADTLALRRLRDHDQYLVTYPGDTYRIVFDLPAGVHDPELFLEAQGYYYEWMRHEWLAEEDPAMAALALLQPAAALRALAPAFKRVESRMEQQFWSSRFGSHP